MTFFRFGSVSCQKSKIGGEIRKILIDKEFWQMYNISEDRGDSKKTQNQLSDSSSERGKRREKGMSDGQQNSIIDELKKKSASVDYGVKLPDAEFDVMSAVWAGEPPLTTAYLMQRIGNKKGWKAPTLISFLTRLEERGFIASFKKGKERYYLPLADREKYLHAVTVQFVAQYHGGSFVNFMNAFFRNRGFDDQEIDALLDWLKSRY